MINFLIISYGHIVCVLYMNICRRIEIEIGCDVKDLCVHILSCAYLCCDHIRYDLMFQDSLP